MHYVHGPDSGAVIISVAAPIAEPSSTTTAVDAPSSTTTAVAAYAPTAGAAPIDNAAKHDAMDRVRAAPLKLSRDTRTPKAWIGYIAFVLFALLKQCRLRVWEGANKFCFIEHFAPWAKNMCPKECAYAAIPCAFRTNPSGVAKCVQISDETPLSKTSHYVAGIDIPSAPLTAVAAATLDSSAFAAFYKALGVHYLPTVCDGDCGLDVMCLIMGAERSLHERTSLRVELSDYLLQRLHLLWMIDILSVTCELESEDVMLARSDEIQVGQELDAFETAVAAIARDDELEPVSEEAMDAMRWASKIEDDCSVLELMRSLPIQVVQEQIRLWNARETAVAASSLPKHKLVVGSFPSVALRQAVAKRFQHVCDTLGLTPANRLPRETMIRFMEDHMTLTDGQIKMKEQEGKTSGKERKHQNKLNVGEWHKAWQREQCDGQTAVAAMSLMKRRAPRQASIRRRAAGWGQTLQSNAR